MQTNSIFGNGLVRLISLLAITCFVGLASAEHRVLMQGNNKLAIVGTDGEIEWEMEWGGIHDLHVLENGHIMVQRNMREIVEIDPETKEVVWSYDSSKKNGNEGKKIEVHAFQPLDDGNIMIAESGPARIIEINRDGEIQKEFKLKVNNPHPHTDTRLVRKLDNGHYLACHERDGTVREYDDNGKVVWQYEIPMFGKAEQGGHGLGAFGNKCFSALRLENGNTLIGTGNGHAVLEVTPDKQIVWQIHQNDLPDIQLAWVTTLEVLPNGNYVIGNCHAGPRNPLLVEVNPETKEVVWQFDAYDIFGNSAPNSKILGPKETKLLTIGDKAPGLAITDWVKGDKVSGLDGDKVYVVEFWATSCAPCLKSMPHISELQTEYGDKVQIIGVTDEFPELIHRFLGRRASETETWDDIITYTLAIDADQETTMSYLGGIDRYYIPNAFIVKDEVIQWIGSPFEIDEPLKRVVEGDWDLAIARSEYEQFRLFENRTQENDPKIAQAFQSKEYDTALDLIAELEAIDDDDVALKNKRITVLRAADRLDEASDVLSKTLKANWEDPASLDIISWNIAASDSQKNDALLQSVRDAMEHAVEVTNGENSSTLDTLARVYFELDDLDKAYETQKRAVAIPGAAEYAQKALMVYEKKIKERDEK